MKVVAVNSTYRPKGTTFQLTAKALEGAASRGAETEHIMLRDLDIKVCTNCLKCYRDVNSEVGPCCLDDDMTSLIDKMVGADGIVFASPVHNGFMSGTMTVMFERLVWRACKPTGSIGGLRGMPQPRTDKLRAVASIASAGGMPGRLRSMCDSGTAFIKENGCHFFNGTWAGSVYAHADLTRYPESVEDWQRVYDLRKLSKRQFQQAFDLGVRVADLIATGKLRPHQPMGAVSSALAGVWLRMGKLYELAD